MELDSELERSIGSCGGIESCYVDMGRIQKLNELINDGFIHILNT